MTQDPSVRLATAPQVVCLDAWQVLSNTVQNHHLRSTKKQQEQTLRFYDLVEHSVYVARGGKHQGRGRQHVVDDMLVGTTNPAMRSCPKIEQWQASATMRAAFAPPELCL